MTITLVTSHGPRARLHDGASTNLSLRNMGAKKLPCTHGCFLLLLLLPVAALSADKPSCQFYKTLFKQIGTKSDHLFSNQ